MLALVFFLAASTAPAPTSETAGAPKPAASLATYVTCTKEQVVKLEPSGESPTDVAIAAHAACVGEYAAVEKDLRGLVAGEPGRQLTATFKADWRESLIGKVVEIRAARKRVKS